MEWKARNRRGLSLNQCREKVCRASGQGPAKRAVSGVEPQAFELAGTDDGDAGRCARAQSRPRLDCGGVGCAGEKFFEPGAQQSDPSVVDLSVSAVDFCRTRHSQTFAKTRGNDPAAFVSEADDRRAFPNDDWGGD